MKKGDRVRLVNPDGIDEDLLQHYSVKFNGVLTVVKVHPLNDNFIYLEGIYGLTEKFSGVFEEHSFLVLLDSSDFELVTPESLKPGFWD